MTARYSVPPRSPSLPPPPRCTFDGADCWTPTCCPDVGCLKATGTGSGRERRVHGPVLDLEHSEWTRER